MVINASRAEGSHYCCGEFLRSSVNLHEHFRAGQWFRARDVMWHRQAGPRVGICCEVIAQCERTDVGRALCKRDGLKTTANTRPRPLDRNERAKRRVSVSAQRTTRAVYEDHCTATFADKVSDPLHLLLLELRLHHFAEDDQVIAIEQLWFVRESSILVAAHKTNIARGSGNNRVDLPFFIA